MTVCAPWGSAQRASGARGGAAGAWGAAIKHAKTVPLTDDGDSNAMMPY